MNAWYCRDSRFLRLLCTVFIFIFLLPVTHQVAARKLPELNVAQLPHEAQQTLQRVQHGGPFTYSKDGAVFGNRERRLAHQPRGYYTEYTVKTAGSHNRGARRIIAGAGRANDPRRSGEYYYTDDHYQTFWRIRMPESNGR